MNIFLPEKVLETQICSLCKQYLSYGPIKVHPREGTLCGRCITNKDAGVISFTNNIVSNIIFPCVNRFEGCNQIIRFADVPEHEKTCVGHQYQCPLCPEDQYLPNSLLCLINHYKIIHSQYYKTEPRFYVDIGSYGENFYLYCEKSENILIIISIQCNVGNLCIGASTVGNQVNKIKYRAKLYVNGSQKYISEERLCPKIGLNFDIVEINPSMILEPISSDILCVLELNTVDALNISLLSSQQEDFIQGSVSTSISKGLEEKKEGITTPSTQLENGHQPHRPLCDNPQHICRNLCVDECGPCSYLVTRYLKCGHCVNIECHSDPNKYECLELVLTKLLCDHQVKKPCSIDPNVLKCPYPCDTRVEPCGHACTRLCHVRVDPDHLEYRCMKPCAKPRVGCGSMESPHVCSRYCYQDCGPCELMVEKIMRECQHKVKIKCNEIPARHNCKSPTCPRQLPCGHKCTKPCQSVCTQNCEEIVNCCIRSPCLHIISKIPCNLKNAVNPQVLMKYCDKPCDVELKCKHRCSGTCGECLQSRIHKRCVEKCGVPLVCNHECPIPCREACKPCTRPCEMKCEHSKCKKQCGEPCTPCKNDCSRNCEHVHCKRPCGAICDVPPCVEKCNKRLKCKHPCVGFCGDPCPVLCRICNEAELTDIFLGNEDEPNAIYVMLNDCGHIFESSDLEGWLNQNEYAIQFKVCPRCSTNITTTVRYSDYIKRVMQDVALVKEKSFGIGTDNERLRAQLTNELRTFKLNRSSELYLICRKLNKEVTKMLQRRLQPTLENRRQPINSIELNAVKSKLQTLNYILECFKDVKYEYSETDASIVHLNVLVQVLLRSIDLVTDQEVADLELEIRRLHRIVQFEKVKKSFNYPQSPTTQVLIFEDQLRSLLIANKRYTDEIDRNIKSLLTVWTDEARSSIVISDKERMEIVTAMRLAKGQWFKCPNGHPYAIGDCGGAMQVAKCFCGAEIGGNNYRLLASNQFAGEMDDADRHAWPGGLH